MRPTPFAIFALLASSALCAFPACVTDTPDAGCVHFGERTGSDFDKFINGPSSTQQWISSHFWRVQTSPGWFDPNLTWYHGAWAYYDSYAIYNPSTLASQHPEWILRDGNGNKLFIPWGCSNGTCPQYAADISNQAYRDYWINNAKSIIAKGYKGLWIDDVNLFMQVGNGTGQRIAPIDPNTGLTMTDQAWEQYFADFMTEVRDALPNAEIVHNSIWSSGSGTPGSDPIVQQEIRAADYINRESGVSDAGLTGNDGYWSIQSLFRFFDIVHANGASVIVQEFSSNNFYGEAAYFLISEGNDAMSDGSVSPNNWPANYDVVLGQPLGGRYDWNGLIRRDFENGLVLLNPPGKATVNASIPANFSDVDGNPVSSVSLEAKHGIVLVGSAPVAPPPPLDDPPPVVLPPPIVVDPPPPPGTPNYAQGFSATGLALNGTASINSGRLRLTSGQGFQTGAAYFNSPIDIQRFTTDFTFHLSNAQADGFTFLVQGNNSAAMGATGGGLGSQNIPKSVAVKFDLYDNSGEGSSSVGLYLNGASPATPSTGTPGMNLRSGDTFKAHVIYDGSNVGLTLTDMDTSNSFTTSFAANIPGVVGGTTAYVGFTGATGGLIATQDILTWTWSTDAATVTPPVVGGIGNGTYTLTNQCSHLVLDDPYASMATGVQPWQWPSNGTAAQHWTFRASGAYYTIQNQQSRLYLSAVAGSKLTQQKATNDDMELWSLQPTGSNYTIKNKATGKVIDDSAQSTKPQTGMILYQANGGSNQAWKIQ
jgi:hypothetical protein